jgi:LacI family transcriptional regulator
MDTKGARTQGRRPTIDDIARASGLAKATVSRALNGRGEVHPSTRERVLRTASELGYVPQAAAHALRTGRSRCLGLLLPSVQWPWLVDVLQGVADAVSDAGYTLLLFSTAKGEQTEREFVTKVLPSRPMDGLLLIVPPGLIPSIRDLAAHGLPVVVVDDRGHPAELPSVSSANRQGASLATRHLLELGRRRIAVIAGPMEYGCCRDRLAGYTDALDEAGVEFDPSLVVDADFTAAGGTAALASLLSRDASVDAVFAMNDLMAIGALDLLDDRVPQDVSVVGFDDIAAAELTRPRLTTVHQPLYEMGQTAVALALEAIESGVIAEQNVTLPTTLVVRESCGGRP